MKYFFTGLKFDDVKSKGHLYHSFTKNRIYEITKDNDFSYFYVISDIKERIAVSNNAKRKYFKLKTNKA